MPNSAFKLVFKGRFHGVDDPEWGWYDPVMEFYPNMDMQVRSAAFAWLREQMDLLGDDVLPRALLSRGFVFQGHRVPLISPKGIFKPRILPDIPLSITTAPRGPYDDSFGPDGLLAYRYRGSDPRHRDNAGLRLAMRRGTPLVYFHGVVPGKYLAVWPVFIVGDDPHGLTFTVAVDDAQTVRDGLARGTGAADDASARRVYITSQVRQRLHQRGFRERVMQAYRRQCAMCRLKHAELLDAAHIIGDTEAGGDPVVPNGLSLCKIHHAAFDQNILGVDPDYRILVREDILHEKDGPMLRHGLQELQGSRLIVPRRADLRPDRDRLARRFEKFLKAG